MESKQVAWILPVPLYLHALIPFYNSELVTIHHFYFLKIYLFQSNYQTGTFRIRLIALLYDFSARKMRKPPKRRVNSSATSRRNPILTLNSTLHYQNVSRIIYCNKTPFRSSRFSYIYFEPEHLYTRSQLNIFSYILKFHRSKFDISSATSVSE